MMGVYSKLIAWLNAATPEGVTVIVRNPSAPNPPAPFVTVKVQSNQDIAADYSMGVGEDEEQSVTRFKTLTVAIQVQGAAGDDSIQAENIAQSIMRSLYDHNKMIDHLGRTVAFGSVLLAPTDISYNASNQWIPRVQIDLSFNATDDYLINSGMIETVHISGEVGNQIIESEVESNGN